MSMVILTPFQSIYDSFFGRITDDMYMEWTKDDTYADAQNLLINALDRFEFPRFRINEYELGELKTTTTTNEDGTTTTTSTWVDGGFADELTREEIGILSLAMVIEWLGRQLATTENTRMKYSGSDFKFTSQANHMSKIKVLMDKYETECLHMQRLYKRRKVDDNGILRPTMNTIMGGPRHDNKI